MNKPLIHAFLAAATLLCGANAAPAAQSSEERSLNELRLTVVNLLEGLVEKGVLTREQAESMVAAAQQRAEAEAAADAEREKAEAGAVRVPYVPQIVRDEIRREVVAELTTEVAREVVEQARSEDWGVPAALPEWIKRVRWSGDVRVRSQVDAFASDNLAGRYLDFLTVNDRGGVARAGVAAFSNVTEDRQRLRARLRLGLDAELGYGWSLGARIATGNLRDPVSTNQTLGNTGARYQTGLDLAYAKWYGNSDDGDHVLNVWAGRMPNPWFATDLLWDGDLTFEGVAANYRLGLGSGDPYSHFAYATLGAFPIEEVELSNKDKWLAAAQVGLDWKFQSGSRLRVGAAYYDFRNTAGVRNVQDSALQDFTAPRYLQRGNTLFDIRNDADTTTNLYALASEFRVVNATAIYDLKVSELHRATLTLDYVRNLGFDEREIQARIGTTVPVDERTEGYQAEIAFGHASLANPRAWRAFVGYRYLQGDAVLDAFTDSDFRLGGTDVKGFYLGGDYAFSPRVSARLRYLSGNEIDGAPFGVDVIQLDLNTSF